MYQRQGRYDLAEKYAEQALAARRRVLGTESPDTMASEADLALAYLSRGQFAESEPAAREALEVENKIQPDSRLARIDPKLLSPVQHRSRQGQADLTVTRAQAWCERGRRWSTRLAD